MTVYWNLTGFIQCSSFLVTLNYPIHEMDFSQFINAMDERYENVYFDAKLKTIRENRGLSQVKLSDLSGVNLRSIQMYEQRVNDIDKAHAQTIYKLSKVLGCKIEDLLENPMK